MTDYKIDKIKTNQFMFDVSVTNDRDDDNRIVYVTIKDSSLTYTKARAFAKHIVTTIIEKQHSIFYSFPHSVDYYIANAGPMMFIRFNESINIEDLLVIGDALDMIPERATYIEKMDGIENKVWVFFKNKGAKIL